MIGRGEIEIGARSDGVNDFLNGITTGPEVNDGGYSSDTDGGNFIAKPGVLFPPGAITDASTNLTDEIIASVEDPTYVGKDRLFLDDSGDFYSLSGTTLTQEVTTSLDVTLGTSDFVAWSDDSNGLMFYATTGSGGGAGDIARWNKTSTVVTDWWTNASHRNQAALSSTTAWRPMLVFEKNLFIGDKNKLHRVTPALVTSNAILTLDATETISALGIDNNSGNILIGVTTGVDYSAGRNGRSRIFYYDGFSNKASKVAEVNGTITSFLSVGSATYVFYGNKMGLFTGSGIRFLRKLRFAIGTAGNLIYPHRRCVIDDTVYIAENASVVDSTAPTTVLAYGPLITGGQNVFYPVITPATSSQPLTMLCSIGGNKLGMSYASSKFAVHDTTSIAAVATTGQNFYSRWYRFPRPVNLFNIKIDFETPITTGSNNIGTVWIKGEDGSTTSIQVIAQDANNTQGTVVTAAIGKKTQAFRLLWVNNPSSASDVFGVRRFTIGCEYVE